MSTTPPPNWKYLGPDPKARVRRQLFIKGTFLPAYDLYACYVNEEEPMTPEEIAEGYGVPLEAVLEAIAYCESDPPEIRQDFEEEEARHKSMHLKDPNLEPPMRATPRTSWVHLEPRPKSAYRQLFIKGTRIRARILYGMFMREEAPLTPEEIAEDYNLPLEAVKEAIAYCQSNPSEIEEDFRREEALMEATGMKDPKYKYHPTPKVISPQERARILNS
jgi:uncharacterized protein (DUF433 family)